MRLIDATRKRVERERAAVAERDARATEAQLGGPLAEHQAREVAKAFASQEVRRLDVLEHQRTSQKREREQEDATKQKAEDEKDFNEKWADAERRDARIGLWRDYQGDDRAKKQATIRTAKQYTQEEKVETKPKFGQAELNSWRKDWK